MQILLGAAGVLPFIVWAARRNLEGHEVLSGSVCVLWALFCGGMAVGGGPA